MNLSMDNWKYTRCKISLIKQILYCGKLIVIFIAIYIHFVLQK